MFMDSLTKSITNKLNYNRDSIKKVIFSAIEKITLIENYLEGIKFFCNSPILIYDYFFMKVKALFEFNIENKGLISMSGCEFNLDIIDKHCIHMMNCTN